MSAHERALAEDIVNPDLIADGFAEIGGNADIKQEIHDLVVLPLQRPDIFLSGASSLRRPPRGILLYGPPGTGKTMLAKAIAKESGAVFVNIRMSTMLNKYVGESNKLVRAVWRCVPRRNACRRPHTANLPLSLAAKLAPAVLFLDEIDAFLRHRGADGGSSCDATRTMKAEFMSSWDGMLSEADPTAHVVVLGATNRPWDCDPAILRRLPRQFEVALPTALERRAILGLLLADERLDDDVSLDDLASDDVTDGYSGSDIKELCRAAVMFPLRELVRRTAGGSVTEGTSDDAPRPLTKADFDKALGSVREAGADAADYQRRSGGGRQPQPPSGPDPAALMRAMMAAMMAGATNGGDSRVP